MVSGEERDRIDHFLPPPSQRHLETVLMGQMSVNGRRPLQGGGGWQWARAEGDTHSVLASLALFCLGLGHVEGYPRRNLVCPSPSSHLNLYPLRAWILPRQRPNRRNLCKLMLAHVHFGK